MHVALNAWFWNRPDTGSGQYTRRLAESLVGLEPDLETTLVAPRGYGYHTSRYIASRVSHSVGTGAANLTSESGSLRKTWFEQVAFPRACRRLAQVAHVPYWAPPLMPSVPTVVTIHDLIPLLLREYRGGPQVRLYTALVATAARSAALVLTDSEASRADILAHLHLPPERVRAVPLAADACYQPDPRPEDEAIRARYDLPARYVLYLGGFDVRKNVGTALSACVWTGPVLGQRCPLVVAGHLPRRDTSFAPDPRRQARQLGLKPDWVRFVGPVEEMDKPALYRGAVALLFPSRYEGFGLPPLEAMACGTPVVGSDASSLPEVIGAAGVLLDPDDAQGMAGAIIQMVQDDGFRGALVQRALAQATRFSWERTARETLAAYRETLGLGETRGAAQMHTDC